jgi:hypothetical protein
MSKHKAVRKQESVVKCLNSRSQNFPLPLQRDLKLYLGTVFESSNAMEVEVWLNFGEESNTRKYKEISM